LLLKFAIQEFLDDREYKNLLESSQQDGQFNRIAPYRFKQVIEFLVVVEAANEAILFGAFYFICRIGHNQV